MSLPSAPESKRHARDRPNSSSLPPAPAMHAVARICVTEQYQVEWEAQFAGRDAKDAAHSRLGGSNAEKLRALFWKLQAVPPADAAKIPFLPGHGPGLAGAPAAKFSNRDAVSPTIFRSPLNFVSEDNAFRVNQFFSPGQCHRFSLLYMLFRRLGLDPDATRQALMAPATIEAFRRRLPTYLSQNSAYFFRWDAVSTMYWQALENDIRRGRLPGLPMAAGGPAVRLRRSVSYFVPVGGFRSDPAMPWRIAKPKWFGSTHPAELQITIRDTKIRHVYPKSGNHSLHDFPVDLDAPNFAALLFSGMHRTRQEIDVQTGVRYEYLPYVYLSIQKFSSKRSGVDPAGGHGLAVEFAVEDDRITVPTRIFDTNLGYIDAKGRGFNSASFQFVIEMLFNAYTGNHVGASKRDQAMRDYGYGRIVAEQLMMITTGEETRPAKIRSRGGMPWMAWRD